MVFLRPSFHCGTQLLLGLASTWTTTLAQPSPGQTSNVAITSGGQQRNYLIFTPPLYDSNVSAPLILSYHGGLRTAEHQLALDQFTNPEFNPGAFVVYPQGIDVCFFLSFFLSFWPPPF